MICEREEEIEAFMPREYWSRRGRAAHTRSRPFTRAPGQARRPEVRTVHHHRRQDRAKPRAQRLVKAAGDALHVTDVTSKERKRRPSPPFITSTLQQEAARKLGFTTSRTMRVAQKLYEGVAIGEEGTVGLISYMRTDSTHLSDDALAEMRDVIARDFGTQRGARQAQRLQDQIQERAGSARGDPPDVRAAHAGAASRKYLGDDERRLYELIWKRTVASQMVPATLNTVSVELAAGNAARLPRQRHHRDRSGLPGRVRGRQGRRRPPRTTTKAASCRR